MRVYHFLSAEHALDDLQRKRIKLSEIDKLNDPFELWCVAHGDRKIRAALRAYKTEMAQRFGLLCFSRGWHNPVLWSHYADSHRGICLGFEVVDEGLLKAVTYVTARRPLQLPPTPETMEQLNFTKYGGWSYEEELRGWVSLEERDASTGLYFCSFDEKVQLREVIAGPLCDTHQATIHAALRGYDYHIRVIKARLAFTSFRIVENQQGFSR
jgi:hypothetical protein